jgi:serine/threonine-protein kinase RsbW
MKMTTFLRLPSELGYEKVAMVSAATIAKRMGFSPDRIEDIKTAVAEACINAIEHGNQLNFKLPVLVDLNEDGGTLEICVSDQGQKQLPCQLPCPGDHPLNRHWGLFLIQNLVDEFSLGMSPQGGNAICMRLFLARGSVV